MKKIIVELWVEDDMRDFRVGFDEVMHLIVDEEYTWGDGDFALGSYAFQITEE